MKLLTLPSWRMQLHGTARQSQLGAAALPCLYLCWPRNLKAYTPHSSHTFCFSKVSLLNHFTSQPHKSTKGKAERPGITFQAAQAQVCWAEQGTVPPARATHATVKGKQTTSAHQLFIKQFVSPSSVWKLCSRQNTTENMCHLSSGSTKAHTLEDCFCYKPFAHVFLVLTLFLLFNKLLLTTALLSETLLPQKITRMLLKQSCPPVPTVRLLAVSLLWEQEKITPTGHRGRWLRMKQSNKGPFSPADTENCCLPISFVNVSLYIKPWLKASWPPQKAPKTSTIKKERLDQFTG